MKPGDVIKCISVADGLHSVLTEGKTYTVLDSNLSRGNLSTVYIISDNGRELGFSPKRFIKVEKAND